MSNNLTVIIPTIRQNIFVLNKLIDILSSDKVVKKIIVIVNKFDDINIFENIHINYKVYIINNNFNNYVNPSWNQGLKLVDTEYYALFNDDIIVRENFCRDVINIFPEDAGLIGINNNSVIRASVDIVNHCKFDDKKINISKTNIRNNSFGIAMFGKVSNYFYIPNSIKVWYGDDYIFNKCIMKGYNNYTINNVCIYHLHSLSSSKKEFDLIKKFDYYFYKIYMFGVLKTLIDVIKSFIKKICKK